MNFYFFSREILRKINFSDIKEKVLELKALKNIDQHLDLIAGLPGEDYDSFKEYHLENSV